MPKGVKCFVEECVYYAHRDCTAEEIEVRSNGNDIVGTVKGTLCGTFAYQNLDGRHVHHQLDTHS